jgi:ABC-type glycerol-3-phosphate transport system substrate-binding protein
MKRALFILFALAVGAGGLFAGGKAEAKVQEISWQVWVTPNLTREYWDGVVKAFEAANPSIKVKVIEANANITPSADDFIKTRLAAGDVPDVWQNATVNIFAEAGHLWEIPKDDPDLKKVNNIMAAAYKGKLYAFNSSIQPQGLIFYNKKLWAQAGLTSTPKNWAEFDAACDKLAAAKITPIITGGEWVAGYAYLVLTVPELYNKNPQWYADRWAGKVHFTDEAVVEASARFRDMVEKGWFNKGALSVGYTDLEQQFLAGKGAMYPMGSWFTAAEAAAKKDFDVGVFYSPTKSGEFHLLQSLSFGTTPVIYAKSKNTDAAWKLVKFSIMDPTFGAKFIQVDGLFSALNPPLTYPMSQLQKDLAALLPQAKTTSGLYNLMVGDTPPNGINAEFDKVGQTLLAGGVKDVKALLKTLDDFWDKAKR